MAAQQMSPQLAQEVAAFQQRFPNFDLSTGFGTFDPYLKSAQAGGDPQAQAYFLQLRKHLADEGFHLNSSGDPQQNMAKWKQILLAATVVGAPGAAYAAIGPGAATTAGGVGPVGSDALGLGPSGLPLAVNVPPSLAAPAATTGGAAGTTAATAAGGNSLLHALLPSIIGAGATIGGTAISAHANTEAAKLQAEQADKALQLQKEQYALQRQDTAPYRALGQGAVGNLGYLSGIDVASKVPELSATVPKVPYGQQAASLSTLGAPPAAPQATFQMMRAPNGLVVKVPADKVQEATQRGGVPVNG
jgi:hypothetical protein